MKFYQWITSLFVGMLIFLTGCVHHQNISVDPELGPAMLRLTSAIQGVAKRPSDYGFSVNGTGEECIRLAVEDDPGLLTPFENYTLKAKCSNFQAVVLLCDKGGSQRLMEDVGCTTKLDFRAEGESHTCAFSFDPAQVCQQLYHSQMYTCVSDEMATAIMQVSYQP